VKITQVDTVRVGEYPNILFVEIQTDEGLVGLGETFMGAAAVEAYIHETAAPYLVGQDPSRIERHALRLAGYLGHGGTGAEARGNSALDIALWDLAGQTAGQPLHQLLGGATRDAIRIYNTCAGYRYIRARPEQRVDNWGLPDGPADGPYEDLDAFLNGGAGELAQSLLAEGITAMKIWPFDQYAEQSDGAHISAADLDRALQPFRLVRAAVGDAMDVMVELHGLWNLPTARRIVAALDEFQPYWYEDPVKMDDVEGLKALSSATSVPIAASETLAGRRTFRRLLEQRLNQVVMLDISWAGGITEARKIAAMADAYQLPVTLHDCTGPVVLTASTHLSVHLPNALVQETVRAYYTSWYRELVTVLPSIAAGYATPPAGPGIGTALNPEVRHRADTTVVTTSAAA
jgi:L-alanine-DL-glutamate epimerase-like enolase superfamily enzyme